MEDPDPTLLLNPIVGDDATMIEKLGWLLNYDSWTEVNACPDEPEPCVLHSERFNLPLLIRPEADWENFFEATAYFEPTQEIVHLEIVAFGEDIRTWDQIAIDYDASDGRQYDLVTVRMVSDDGQRDLAVVGIVYYDAAYDGQQLGDFFAPLGTFKNSQQGRDYIAMLKEINDAHLYRGMPDCPVTDEAGYDSCMFHLDNNFRPCLENLKSDFQSAMLSADIIAIASCIACMTGVVPACPVCWASLGSGVSILLSYWNCKHKAGVEWYRAYQCCCFEAGANGSQNYDLCTFNCPTCLWGVIGGGP